MNQGATFGIQEVQKHLLSLVAVLVVGIIADAIGAQLVMVVAPALIIGIVLWLLRYSYRSIEHVDLSRREAWEMLRTEAAEP